MVDEGQAQKPKGNILIVDDMESNLRLLSSILNQHGYSVRAVTNGSIALKRVSTNPPDLILLDITMPILDGYEVCQALKSDPKTREIPVIFLSGLDEVFDKVKAFQVGGADYLTKPFQFEELIVRIENQLTIQRQRALLQEEIRKHEQTEELLASIFNSSLDGVAAFQSVRNERGNIVDFTWLRANPLAAMTLSINTDVIGKRLLEQLPGEQFKKLFDLFVQVVETGAVVQKEYHYQHDWNEAWFQIVAVKLGDGVALTFRDISEYKAMQLALQEANRDLHRQANIDSLTKVANRRRFNKYFSQEWRRCARERKPLALILCDVDYFKRYNDYYGHQKGDECLVKVARAIDRALKRPGDLVARYGGEEFAVILPNTNSEGAIQVAEAIRWEMQRLQIPHARSEISDYITVSLGVSTKIPSPYLLPEILIDGADRALYEAKDRGRNRIIVNIL